MRRGSCTVGRLLLHECEVHLLDARVAPLARHVAELGYIEAIAAAAAVALGQRAELLHLDGHAGREAVLAAQRRDEQLVLWRRDLSRAGGGERLGARIPSRAVTSCSQKARSVE